MSLAHSLLPDPLPSLPSAPTRTGPGHLQLVPRLPALGTSHRAADLYRRFGATVYRRCRRLLRDESAAADATQEVFLRLVRNADALAGRADLLPWLYRVATNHCYNVLRDARGHAEEPLDELHEPACAPTRSMPDARLMRQVLSQFDEATQAIAVGIIVEGMEAEEMARQLGVSRRTISRKLDRFLARAQACLLAGVPA